MASSKSKRPNYGRRFFWLALAIVLVAGIYSAGWFYAADYLTGEVNARVAKINRDGKRASCEEAETRGYPFRIGVFCRSVMFEDARGGVGFRARQFRSAAQIYAPRHVIGELDGPATLQAPGLNALDLNWDSLRASVRLAMPLPERISLEGTALTVRLDEPGDISPLLGAAGRFELHMRPAGDDLDVAARFSDLRLDAELTGIDALAPLDGVVDVTVEDGVKLLRDAQGGLRGRSGTIRSASVSLNGRDAGIGVSGPVSVDDNGMVDATLEVTITNPRVLGEVLTEIAPESRREIEMAVSGLSALGDAPVLPLRIAKGEMRLGFLSLGSIPPL